MQPQDVVKHRGRKWKEEVMDENVPPVKKPNLIDSFGTPAYRRREQSKLTCTNELGISYDLTANHENSSSSSDELEYVATIGYEKLTKVDLDRLKQKRGWLNDRLINTGQVLLKEKFPDVGGLQNVDLARTLCFAQNEPSFVQNLSDSHWVCVTSIGCNPNMVKVYNR